MTILDTIRSRIRLSLEHDCWEWEHAHDRLGYGQIRLGTIACRVHRVAWEAVYGLLPEGMEVCHSCDNPRCCNPDHLFDGSHQQNMKDASRKGRMNQGDKNGLAKLTEEQVRYIRLVYKPRHSKFGQGALARRLGVTQPLIHYVIFGGGWKHIK